MIIDLETERRNGLDESQLATDVMRLMHPSETCNGPVIHTALGYEWCFLCEACAYRQPSSRNTSAESLSPHPRVPKPLREVRDELIEWLESKETMWAIWGSSSGKRITLTKQYSSRAGIKVKFTAITDVTLALALGAVRLMERRH